MSGKARAKGGARAAGGPRERREAVAAGRGFAPVSLPAAWAAVLLGGILVAAAVFLFPHERLSTAYDWFQNWSYHKEFLRRTLREDGVVPLWCRWSFSGKPFQADVETQLLYPGNWLHVLLPPAVALPLDVLVHFALAGAGMFLFCRARGAGVPAALFGGILWPATGFNIAHTTVGHIHYYAAVAWLPFVFLSVERWVASRAPRWIAAGAAAIALQVFAGAFAVSWMTLAFGALYGAGRIGTRLADPAARRTAGIAAGGLLALLGLGLALAAAQLLPTRELASLSLREGRGFAYAATDALPVRELLHLLVPQTLGPTLAWEYYGYFGLTALALAAVSVASGLRRGWWLLPALGVLALVLMVGDATPLFRLLYAVMPGVSMFRTHAREVCVLSFVVIALAVDGLERIGGGEAGESGRAARAGRAGMEAGWALVGFAVVGALVAKGTPSPAAASPAAGWIWAAAVAAGGWVLSRTNRPGGLARRLPLVLAACAIVELLAAERSVRERITIRTGAPPAQAGLETLLRSDAGDYRFWFPRSQFMSDHGYAVEKSAVEGYENMLLRRYQTYIHAMTGAPVKPDVINILTQGNFSAAPTPFPFKALNVKQAVLPQRDGSYPLFENPDPPGPAFLPGAAQILGEEAILARMREPDWDPRRVALLETVPEGWSGGDDGPAGTVTLVHENPNRLVATIQAERAAILVLSEIDYPGWEVAVEGRPARLLRADYLLRAVAVPAGRHEAVFTFRPAALRNGLLASAAAAAVCAGLLCVSLVRRSAPAAPPG